MAKTTEEIVEELVAPRSEPKTPLKDGDLLSSGCTLLNLALSDRAKGAFYKGKYYHLVGDSDAGKTVGLMTAMAEASISKRFKDYQLIHDNPEDGQMMDVERYWGPRLAKRLRAPRYVKGEAVMSQTMEEFWYNLDDAMNAGPVVYALDSLDALSSEADGDKFQKRKKARNSGKAETGTFGTAKAKVNAGAMREVFNKLKKTGSILFIVSQARMAIGNPFETKTFAGGTALKFFCRGQVWYSVGKTVTKKVGSKTRQLGIVSLIRVKKNHQTGRRHTVKVPIFWATGIDDTGSCVDWLIEEGHWRRSKGGIDTRGNVPEVLNREELIKYIETNNMTKQLQSVVETAWSEIKKACTPERVNKYGGGK